MPGNVGPFGRVSRDLLYFTAPVKHLNGPVRMVVREVRANGRAFVQRVRDVKVGAEIVADELSRHRAGHRCKGTDEKGVHISFKDGIFCGRMGPQCLPELNPAGFGIGVILGFVLQDADIKAVKVISAFESLGSPVGFYHRINIGTGRVLECEFVGWRRWSRFG